MLIVAHMGSGELQNDENISPTVAEPKVTNLEFKTRKIFVSPLLQATAAPQAAGFGSRSEANSRSVSVKRSGYFSRPAPFQLDAAIPESASKDMDVLADYQEHDTDTQDSGRICFADQGLEDPDDAAGCPPTENVFIHNNLSNLHCVSSYGKVCECTLSSL